MVRKVTARRGARGLRLNAATVPRPASVHRGPSAEGDLGGVHTGPATRRTTARPCRASGRLAHDADDLILPLRYSHASERCSGALGRRLHERRLLGIRGWREE